MLTNLKQCNLENGTKLVPLMLDSAILIAYTDFPDYHEYCHHLYFCLDQNNNTALVQEEIDACLKFDEEQCVFNVIDHPVNACLTCPYIKNNDVLIPTEADYKALDQILSCIRKHNYPYPFESDEASAHHQPCLFCVVPFNVKEGRNMDLHNVLIKHLPIYEEYALMSLKHEAIAHLLLPSLSECDFVKESDDLQLVYSTMCKLFKPLVANEIVKFDKFVEKVKKQHVIAVRLPNEDLAGVLLFEQQEDVMFLKILFKLSDKMSVLSPLMGKAFSWAKSHDCSEIRLFYSTYSNKGVADLYHKYGFVETGVLESYYLI